MNKRIIIGLFLAIVLSLSVVSAPATANVGTTTLTAVTPTAVTAGATVDFTFTVDVNSPDLEYLSRVNVDLPAEWTINSMGALPTVTGCTGTTPSSGNIGQTVWWGEAPDGCGPWQNGTYDFSVNVTVTSCANAPWDLPWLIEGDVFGAAPHTVSGTYSSITCTGGAVAGINVPHKGLVLINAWEPTVAYDSPGGNPVTLSGGGVLVLPHDADGNGYDTYVVTEITTVDGESWVGLFIGNETWVYVPWSAVHPASYFPE